jgi:hypothetical protein
MGPAVPFLGVKAAGAWGWVLRSYTSTCTACFMAPRLRTLCLLSWSCPICCKTFVNHSLFSDIPFQSSKLLQSKRCRLIHNNARLITLHFVFSGHPWCRPPLREVLTHLMRKSEENICAIMSSVKGTEIISFPLSHKLSGLCIKWRSDTSTIEHAYCCYWWQKIEKYASELTLFIYSFVRVLFNNAVSGSDCRKLICDCYSIINWDRCVSKQS